MEENKKIEQESVKRYPQNIIDLQNNICFREAVLKRMKVTGGTQKSAFEEINNNFHYYYGHHKFIDYQSYLNTITMALKKRKTILR